MSDYYLGEIRIFGRNFAPQDWNLCDGTKLKVADFQGLFSLIGTTYGGDGVNEFWLPDLRGRTPIGLGQGPGLSNRLWGQTGGAETVTLTSANIPAHSHTFNTLNAPATTGTLISDTAATGTKVLTYAQGVGGVRSYLNNSAVTPTAAALQAASVTASSQNATQPHQNMMPSFVMNFIICTMGLYPARP